MEFEAKAEGGGHVTWPSAMSFFVLTYLANVVASGKTSLDFKKTHLNSCVKALNDHFKCKRTREQISNHLRTQAQALMTPIYHFTMSILLTVQSKLEPFVLYRYLTSCTGLQSYYRALP